VVSFFLLLEEKIMKPLTEELVYGEYTAEEERERFSDVSVAVPPKPVVLRVYGGALVGLRRILGSYLNGNYIPMKIQDPSDPERRVGALVRVHSIEELRPAPSGLYTLHCHVKCAQIFNDPVDIDIRYDVNDERHSGFMTI
jgi:hypothetical protein